MCQGGIRPSFARQNPIGRSRSKTGQSAGRRLLSKAFEASFDFNFSFAGFEKKTDARAPARVLSLASRTTQARHHPQGRPTPENSAGAIRADGDCVTDRSCDEQDEGPGEKPPRDDASSPRGAGRDSPAPPWVRNTATGRRSRRPRARNDGFTRRFAEAQAETTTTLAAPVPRRPLAAAAAEAPERADAATPQVPAHLRVTDATAAELLVGSPGAGMAAADTLLMLLMTAGADAESPSGESPPGAKAAQNQAGRAPRPAPRPASGLRPKGARKRAAPESTAAPRTASATVPAKKRKPEMPTKEQIPTPSDAGRDARRDAAYGGPAIVPDTAMYNAASAAAAKRRLLPSRGGGRQKVHRPWTPPEVEALVEGVAHYGRGQWADIKSLQANGVAAALATRSAVDLKDKWRNLLRIAMLPVLYKRREATEVPAATLARVRELAAQKAATPGGARAGEQEVAGSSPAGDSSSPAAAVPKGARRSKHHSPWTLTESEALVDGVARCAGCRWTVIKKLGLESLERRTAMDLKDKWRNLLQLASLPTQSRRKAETPPELLQKVLRLEAEFGVARRKGRKAADGAPAAAATA